MYVLWTIGVDIPIGIGGVVVAPIREELEVEEDAGGGGIADETLDITDRSA